jgi:hypothetical protein
MGDPRLDSPPIPCTPPYDIDLVVTLYPTTPCGLASVRSTLTDVYAGSKAYYVYGALRSLYAQLPLDVATAL